MIKQWKQQFFIEKVYNQQCIGIFFDRYPFLSPQGVGLPHTFCDVQFIEHYHKDVDLFVEVGLTMGKYLREPPIVLPMRLKTYIENFPKKREGDFEHLYYFIQMAKEKDPLCRSSSLLSPKVTMHSIPFGLSGNDNDGFL